MCNANGVEPFGGTARTKRADAVMRDREIRAAWEVEFLTLQEIGDRHGITRERVRQILNRMKALSPAQQRELKVESENAYLATLGTAFEKSAYELAKGSASREELLQALQRRFLDLTRIQVEQMLRATGLTVTKQRVSTDRFSDGQLRLAVYLCFGLQYELALANRDYSGFASSDIRVDLEALSRAEVFPAIVSVDLALSAIGFFFSKLEEGGLDPFTHMSYEKVRKKIWVANEWDQGARVSRWPPTHQTVARRLGGGFWSDATDALGFPSSERSGRSRGGAASDPDWVWDVLARFVRHCKEKKHRPSVSNFDSWRKSNGQSESKMPSSATIRKVVGSWSAAINRVRFESSSQGFPDGAKVLAGPTKCIHDIDTANCDMCGNSPRRL